jgi:tetratricopeptide (TPR) repeat protein
LQKVTDLYFAGNDEAMQNQLQRAMEMPEAAPYALKMKGLLDLNQKNLPAAQNELQHAATALPWDAEAQALLAYALYCGNDFASGADTAFKALEVDSNQPLAHLVIALVQLDTHQHESGLQHLRKAANLGLLPAQVLLANHYAWKGQQELAEQTWRDARAAANQIHDRRVRQDAMRWLERHQAFSQTSGPHQR